MKKLSVILLALALTLSLFGCGSSAKFAESAASDMAFETPAESEEAYWDGGESVSASQSGAGDANSTAQRAVKMIYRASLELQTTAFEDAQKDIAELVKSCGGYFENKSVSSYSSDYRCANYTVRVPSEKYEAFCNQVGEMCHVVWSDSSAENISESYYDTESRLETAQIKLDRLQELLSKATNMEDIITLESAIGETEHEIDSLQGTLRSYDLLVDYATVYLNLNEVYKLSGTEDAPKTYGEKLGLAFAEGFAEAGELLSEMLLWLAYNWLVILIWAVIVIAALLLVKRILFGRRRFLKGNKKTAESAESAASAEPTAPTAPAESAESKTEE